MWKRRLLALFLAITFSTALMGGGIECDFDVDDDDCDFFCDD
ncbi:MAG TPA: hypothetical protein VNT79_07825 [Phycisphaerae bacterium]|nr:hypothetical protein [Phycisphaerae bacterium]